MLNYIMDNSITFIFIGIVGLFISLLIDTYNGKIGLTDELLISQYVKLIRRRNKLLNRDGSNHEQR